MSQKWKVVLIAGNVKKTYLDHLTLREAVGFCIENNWELSPDGPGGFVWHLDYEESSWSMEEVVE